MKIMVLMGGGSPEREISLISGKAVADSLKRSGFKVIEDDFSIASYDRIIKEKPDLVFIMLHGSPGEDGSVQGMLEILGARYTGSKVLASSLCIDKAACKRFLNGSEINMPKWFLAPKSVSIDIVMNRLAAEQMSYPLVIKPVSVGSTIGISKVNDENVVCEAIEFARKYSSDVMVEEFIEGKEITVSIVGNSEPIVLPSQEIVIESKFYDYEAKYTPGMSHHIFPPKVDPSAVFEAEEMSRLAYVDLGCRGFARADFIIGTDNKPYFLEINTIPGMTEVSLLPDAAREYGWDFDSLIKRIVDYSMED